MSAGVVYHVTHYSPLIHVMFGIIKPHSHLHCVPFSTPLKNILHSPYSSQITEMPFIRTSTILKIHSQNPDCYLIIAATARLFQI
jgi:hypothetical protein